MILKIQEQKLPRCVDCRNCPECKKGGKIESISIQEEVEQHLINRSVDVDIRKVITRAKLPFIFNPSSKLLRNENVAWKVYQGQVKKLDKFFNDLCENDKNTILRNEVQYFIPWRSVWNSNSLSTPCRLVFDASQAGKTGVSLNSLLAKGINSMNRLVEILIRWTMHEWAFHTDIQKMYNAIRLDKSHWCYQMYL